MPHSASAATCARPSRSAAARASRRAPSALSKRPATPAPRRRPRAGRTCCEGPPRARSAARPRRAATRAPPRRRRTPPASPGRAGRARPAGSSTSPASGIAVDQRPRDLGLARDHTLHRGARAPRPWQAPPRLRRAPRRRRSTKRAQPRALADPRRGHGGLAHRAEPLRVPRGQRVEGALGRGEGLGVLPAPPAELGGDDQQSAQRGARGTACDAALDAGQREAEVVAAEGVLRRREVPGDGPGEQASALVVVRELDGVAHAHRLQPRGGEAMPEGAVGLGEGGVRRVAELRAGEGELADLDARGVGRGATSSRATRVSRATRSAPTRPRRRAARRGRRRRTTRRTRWPRAAPGAPRARARRGGAWSIASTVPGSASPLPRATLRKSSSRK